MNELAFGWGLVDVTNLCILQEFFELTYDGENFKAKEVLRYETGGNAVMNCAVFSKSKHSYLAAGQESNCQLYKVKCCICSEEKPNSENRTGTCIRFHFEVSRNLRSCIGITGIMVFFAEANSADRISYNKSLTFQVLPEYNVQTDYS